MATHLSKPIGDAFSVTLREDRSVVGKVQIASKRLCTHVETLCSGCESQWRADWFIATN